MEAGRRLLLTLIAAFAALYTAYGGRALPMESQNQVIDLFQGVNFNIAWDDENFLVDLSGHYAKCQSMKRRTWFSLEFDRISRTDEGESMAGIIDYMEGRESHVNAVQAYLDRGFPRWTQNPEWSRQIANSKEFGCSVRPRCKGYLIFVCLFSPAYPSYGERTTTFPPPITTRRTTTPWPVVTLPPVIEGEQVALAFTKVEYDVAARVMDRRWDQSHYLENLSGFETKCHMVDKRFHDFAFAKAKAREVDMVVEGRMGVVLNPGNTTRGIEQILRVWDSNDQDIGKTNVGCSVIPGCPPPIRERNRPPPFGPDGRRLKRHEYVVVSCIYWVSGTTPRY